MNELEQLKQQHVELKRRITAAEIAAAQVRNQSLIGRCFKFRMRRACYVACAPWWIYFKVMALSGTGVSVFSFERTDTGNCVIESAKFMANVGGANTEITKEEWQQEYVALMAELTEKVFG